MSMTIAHVHELTRREPFRLCSVAFRKSVQISDKGWKALCARFVEYVRRIDSQLFSEFDPKDDDLDEVLQRPWFEFLVSEGDLLLANVRNHFSIRFRRNIIEEHARNKQLMGHPSPSDELLELFSAYVALQDSEWFSSFCPTMEEEAGDWQAVLQDAAIDFHVKAEQFIIEDKF